MSFDEPEEVEISEEALNQAADEWIDSAPAKDLLSVILELVDEDKICDALTGMVDLPREDIIHEVIGEKFEEIEQRAWDIDADLGESAAHEKAESIALSREEF